MAIDKRITKAGDNFFDDNGEIAVVVKGNVIEYDSSKIGGGGGGSALEGRVETLEEKVAGLEEYSTDEVDTGKEWIDGKRIFRRVAHVVSPSINTWVTFLTVTLDDVINLNISIKTSDAIVNVNGMISTNTNDRCVVTYDKDLNGFKYNLGSSRIGTTDLFVIVEYTKP